MNICINATVNYINVQSLARPYEQYDELAVPFKFKFKFTYYVFNLIKFLLFFFLVNYVSSS